MNSSERQKLIDRIMRIYATLPGAEQRRIYCQFEARLRMMRKPDLLASYREWLDSPGSMAR